MKFLRLFCGLWLACLFMGSLAILGMGLKDAWDRNPASIYWLAGVGAFFAMSALSITVFVKK